MRAYMSLHDMRWNGRLLVLKTMQRPLMQIEVTHAPSPSDREAVLSGLHAFMLAKTGEVPVRLSVLVRDENGVTLGGLIGRTSGAWLYVELFWLPETLRGTGLGTRLMMEAEAEAVRRGCIGAHLDTYDYQAPDFYRKLGYEVFGSIDEHPPGHTRFWMRKRFEALAASGSPAG